MQLASNIPRFRFAPASQRDNCVFGAERPGYGTRNVTKEHVQEWILFMREHEIERVCCLLDEEQLDFYKISPLLLTYQEEFGSTNVLHALIPDFHLCSEEVLCSQILPFLEDSFRQSKRTVVHCAGGKGRTGHVLAAWLVRSQAKTPEDALKTVSMLYREPIEAVEKGNATEDSLRRLLLTANV